MPETVVIEFVSDASQLQPAVDTIEKLTGAGSKVNAEFVRTTKVFNETSKSANVAHISIDQMSASVRELNKNVIGNAAQQEVKKLGTEFVATTTESKKLTTELRELKDQLSRLAQSGQSGTAEFKKLQQQAGEAQNQINNTNKAIQILGSSGGALRSLTTVVTGLAGGFALAQGASALFGDKSKDLEKTLIKVQAVMLILNGLTSIQATLQETATIKTALYGGALKVVSALQTAFGVSAATAWALATGGVSLLITGIAFLISALGSSTDAVDEQAAATKKLADEQEKLNERMLKYKDSYDEVLAVYRQEKFRIFETIEKVNERLAQDRLQIELAKVRGAKITEIMSLQLKAINDEIRGYDLLRARIIDLNEEDLESYRNLLNEKQILSAKFFAELEKQREKDLEDIVNKGIEGNDQLEKATQAAHDMALAELEHFVDSILLGQELEFDELQRLVDAEIEAQDRAARNNEVRNKEKLQSNIQFLHSTQQLANTLFEYTIAVTQNEIDALEDKHRRGLISEKEYNKKIAEFRRKQAQAEKEKAVFNIVIGTSLAVINALATGGPAAPVLAALAAATGAAELAIVLARKVPEIPQFAKGTKKAPPGMKLVGEKGPELIVDKGGYPIIPHQDTQKILEKWNVAMPALDVYPETPYVSNATMDSIEQGRSTHTGAGINYDLLADKLSERIAKHPRLVMNIDERGFEKRIIEGANRRKSLDDFYSWNG